MWLVTRVMYRVKVIGAENVPSGGAFIACANHSSYMDPIVVATSIRRRLYFMGKKELFKYKLFGFVLSKVGAFPVDRGSADMKAFKKALEILSGGNGLLLFAQGTRMKEFNEMKNGTALFALKSNSPIVPVGINSNFKLFSKVTIKIGKPVSVEEHKGKRIKTELLENVMEEVSARVKELLV